MNIFIFDGNEWTSKPWSKNYSVASRQLIKLVQAKILYHFKISNPTMILRSNLAETKSLT